MRTPGTVNAGQSWSYNKPARPGDTITLQARALDKFIKRERLFVVHDNVFFSMARSSVPAAARPSDLPQIAGKKKENTMTTSFENLAIGDTISGPKFAVSRESIRLFCDGSLDYNPLHLDDDYMKNSFGKTNFGGIIMHGMNNFGLITRMLTDWAYPAGAIHRRLKRAGSSR